MKTKPITAAEQAHIDAALTAFVQLVDDAGLRDDEFSMDTPELADELLVRWAAEPPRARLPEEVVATIIGAAVGEYLRELLRVSWASVTVGSERSLGLAAEETGEPVLSPFDAVKEGLPQASDGFVHDLLEEVAAEWGKLRR